VLGALGLLRCGDPAEAVFARLLSSLRTVGFGRLLKLVALGHLAVVVFVMLVVFGSHAVFRALSDLGGLVESNALVALTFVALGAEFFRGGFNLVAGEFVVMMLLLVMFFRGLAPFRALSQLSSRFPLVALFAFLFSSLGAEVLILGFVGHALFAFGFAAFGTHSFGSHGDLGHAVFALRGVPFRALLRANSFALLSFLAVLILARAGNSGALLVTVLDGSGVLGGHTFISMTFTSLGAELLELALLAYNVGFLFLRHGELLLALLAVLFVALRTEVLERAFSLFVVGLLLEGHLSALDAFFAVLFIAFGAEVLQRTFVLLHVFLGECSCLNLLLALFAVLLVALGTEVFELAFLDLFFLGRDKGCGIFLDAVFALLFVALGTEVLELALVSGVHDFADLLGGAFLDALFALLFESLLAVIFQ